MYRVVFMGTPTFAVPSLEAVAALPDFTVIMVLSQPDRPSGRGQQLQPSAVKARALALGIPVWTPPSLKAPDAQAELAALAPDLLVVAAYGEILRRRVLELPRFGAINVHASLLPAHRGAAPISAAIAAGDTEAGVTIMQMDVGMDTGDMLATRAIPLRPDHTTRTLTAELAQLGAELLADTLPRWVAREITPQPQQHDAATVTRLLRKEDGELVWHKSARQIEREIRAYDPWPGSTTDWKGQRLKVLAAQVVEEPLPPAAPGTVLLTAQRLPAVATGEGYLGLLTVQLAGKKAMAGNDFVRGYPTLVGSVLGEGREKQ